MNAPADRPLSPHLQIYRPQLTSVLSILHRATGVALTFGLLVVTWGLFALAGGEESFDFFRSVMGSPLGLVALVGWSFAFFYHLCAGVRHLIMDSGRFVSIDGVYKTGYTVLACSAALTAAFWLGLVL